MTATRTMRWVALAKGLCVGTIFMTVIVGADTPGKKTTVLILVIGVSILGLVIGWVDGYRSAKIDSGLGDTADPFWNPK